MQKKDTILSVTLLVAALGYFVDIYELLLFTIVRKPSLLDLRVQEADMIVASTQVINLQMIGLLIGGILWGVMGDKRGRLSVLFGSIIVYSIANFITGYVQSVDQYGLARFVAGIGLAGELGAGITLVSELLPKKKRGIGTSLVAGIGLFGAVFAYFMYQFTMDWRLCYKIGGFLGIALLLLRIQVSESLLFSNMKNASVQRGNFLDFFTNRKRFKKYSLAILIGLPTWYVIGILVNYSNKFAKEMYGDNSIDSGKSIMYAYVGIALGDMVIGFVSQYFESRKKAMFLFYGLSILFITLFFSQLNINDQTMYWICAGMGFASGFWAIFVTMAAEQFGTNLRATATTTIPNMVRGALPLMNLLFVDLFQNKMGFSLSSSAAITGIIVMSIAFLALWFSEETFKKDLNYIEKNK